ncbi:hypothetical protein [Flavobacterium sp. B17]|uniref:hypothetical protein n=1 Tax=Flavobacterium sp. B17 TaxID=95618 RepID=UPI00034D5A3A|nr:hypothetical protein [Flavobacterium sp. B17]
MSATSGQVLGWNGSSWAPTASDTTNDAWINDTTNGLVKLGTKADGTARAAGTDFVVKDNGQVGIGTSSPSTKLEINSSSSGAMKIVDGTQGTSKVLTSDANGLASWSFSGVRTVRVAATGARNTSGTYSLTPGGVIVYTIENLDVDNAYNSTTGVFTAPRDGYYTFEVATYLSSSNTNRDLLLQLLSLYNSADEHTLTKLLQNWYHLR